MAVPNLAWGGFRNGEIPRGNLVDFGGGKLLQADAARTLHALADEFAAAFPGYRLYVGANQDTYRDLAYQTLMSGTGKHLYKPGSSIHGWARSADLSGYGSSSATARHLWLQRNAGRHGWSWAYGRELGEPWHWDYVGPITTTAGGGFGGFEEEPMSSKLVLHQVLKADGSVERQAYYAVEIDSLTLLTDPNDVHFYREVFGEAKVVGPTAMDPAIRRIERHQAALARTVDATIEDEATLAAVQKIQVGAVTADLAPVLEAIASSQAALAALIDQVDENTMASLGLKRV